MDVEKQVPVGGRGLHPSLHIVNWMLWSNLTVLFNKAIIDTGFRYPILLTCWHLIFASIATQLLARYTPLLDSRHSLAMTSRLYLPTLLPIGIFYSGSLVCSNLVYLHLSVAFTQMLKSAAPVVALFVAWAWRLQEPSVGALVNMLVMMAGVGMASVGEVRFSLVGFLLQLAGTIFEVIRLAMIQVMLSNKGLKMEPLVGLYYYAPICAAMNVFVAIPTELPYFRREHLTPWLAGVLVLNALTAFMLNIASVFLIGKTSGLTMTMAGILKNMLLIVASVLIWQTRITLLQAAGYSLALAGLVYYSAGREVLARARQVSASAAAVLAEWCLDNRVGIIVLTGCASLVMVYGLLRLYGAAAGELVLSMA
ncbi:triose-phosphate transporter [Ophiocordyceps camponoti-floridani]|uniref:Triose-phosphate transporter n=1 Tax=Ophiocordyceps camponoti-floridani TaxID=2030778 RepID=A0A8H4Q7S3_9HYPO|nr:triose-phosphate transporter [Ophiocordyceps camponoti-floridani]